MNHPTGPRPKVPRGELWAQVILIAGAALLLAGVGIVLDAVDLHALAAPSLGHAEAGGR